MKRGLTVVAAVAEAAVAFGVAAAFVSALEGVSVRRRLSAAVP